MQYEAQQQAWGLPTLAQSSAHGLALAQQHGMLPQPPPAGTAGTPPHALFASAEAKLAARAAAAAGGGGGGTPDAADAGGGDGGGGIGLATGLDASLVARLAALAPRGRGRPFVKPAWMSRGMDWNPRTELGMPTHR